MNFRTTLSLSALALAAALAGCSTPVKLDEPAQVETRTPTPVAPKDGGAGATTGAAPQSQVTTVDLARQRAEREAAERAAALAASLPKLLYFDFDSYVLRNEHKPTVEGYARLLSGQPAMRMSLQGHADERGGREYNLALGQKRAEAVARALELLGVNAGQVEAVSFGEEKPADAGHDEAAWAKNRRVEFKGR